MFNKRSKSERNETINKIITLATLLLHKDYTSSVIYDRSLLADLSDDVLTSLLDFLNGLGMNLDSDSALKEAYHFKDSFLGFIEEHITLSDVEPFDPTRRGFNPE